MPKISSSSTLIGVEEAARLAEKDDMTLVDIREADEVARKAIKGALHLPLSDIQKGAKLDLPSNSTAIYFCRSGNRTDVYRDQLNAAANGPVMTMQGGITGWEAAGYPIIENTKAPLEIMRQVQIAAGLLILTGVTLGWFVTPAFFGLSAFVGAGLTFAGLSGWCGMAKLLALMPWNSLSTPTKAGTGS